MSAAKPSFELFDSLSIIHVRLTRHCESKN
jgi:hypothetical protein